MREKNHLQSLTHSDLLEVFYFIFCQQVNKAQPVDWIPVLFFISMYTIFCVCIEYNVRNGFLW